MSRFLPSRCCACRPPVEMISTSFSASRQELEGLIQAPYTGVLQVPVERQTMIKTHENFVSSLTTKKLQFCFRPFPQISTLMEIPRGKAWKIAENRTLKWGSSPPRAEMLTFKWLVLKNLRYKTLGQIQNLDPHRLMSRLKSKTTPGDTLRTRANSYRRLDPEDGLACLRPRS